MGGIGSGSIGADLRGGFGRFSLIPGVKEQNQKNVKADQVETFTEEYFLNTFFQFILTVHSMDGDLLHETILSCADFSSSPLASWNKFCSKQNVR